ncbi:tetratricopeptide repeat protein [Streptomyces anulatus]
MPRALLERHRGRALRGLGRLDEAQERARRAPAAFRANGEAYNTARALTDLAEILLAAEKPAAALPLTDEAIRVLSEENAEQEQGSPASTAVGSASGQAAAGRSNCSGWERTRASARGTPSASSQSGASPKTGEAHSGAGPRPRPGSVLGARCSMAPASWCSQFRAKVRSTAPGARRVRRQSWPRSQGPPASRGPVPTGVRAAPCP